LDEPPDRDAEAFGLLAPEGLALLAPLAELDEPVVRFVVFLLVPLERLEVELFFFPPPLLLEPLEPDFRVDDFFFAGIYSSSAECSRCTEDSSSPRVGVL
jgi:hypothetical protein